ncbi:MAG: ABC transporter permease [Chloroflexia bacterium]|nr:ABC transporter permease [Chloroflexia bacterium]
MQYILRRLALVFPLLFGITIITFLLINLAPGDPVSAMLAQSDPSMPDVESTVTLDQIEALREEYGLNRPLSVRYILWLKEIVQGNLGYSLHDDRPVLNLIWERLPASLGLTVTSMALAMIVGGALGVLSALRQYSALDYLLTVLAFFGVAVPGFFFALMGMFIFGIKLQWLPIFGMWTPGEPAEFNLDLIHHAILPVTALAVSQIAEYMRYVRAAILDALGAEHVTTARAKGLQERVVFGRHVFRNALLPLVTIVGLSLPGIIGGSFIIETIFSWPGIGLLGFSAIQLRDYPVQLGIALMAAVAVLLANLLTDIVYGLVDPRIRYE